MAFFTFLCKTCFLEKVFLINGWRNKDQHEQKIKQVNQIKWKEYKMNNHVKLENSTYKYMWRNKTQNEQEWKRVKQTKFKMNNYIKPENSGYN
jgi:hypothetical protein